MIGDGTRQRRRNMLRPERRADGRESQGSIAVLSAVLRTVRGEAALVWKHRQEREGKSEERTSDRRRAPSTERAREGERESSGERKEGKRERCRKSWKTGRHQGERFQLRGIEL